MTPLRRYCRAVSDMIPRGLSAFDPEGVAITAGRIEDAEAAERFLGSRSPQSRQQPN